ncbi:hypothetical protein OROHE_023297 [Orobanche hederae]
MNINENITELVVFTKSIIVEFNLAKFRKEVESSFLGLGFNDGSRNNNKDYYHRKMIVLNPIPLRSYHRTGGCMSCSCFQDSELMKKYSDQQAINLAKFAKEVDKSSFLGLDIDRSSNYKIFNQDSDHTTISGLGNNSASSITTVTDCSRKKRRSPNGNQNNNNNNNVKKRRLIRSHPEPNTPPLELMMENRLRWFGHVRRRPVDAPVRRLESWGTSNIVKGRGRPKKTWIKLIENDMRFLGIGEKARGFRRTKRSKQAVRQRNNSASSITTVTDCSRKKRRSPNGNQNNNNNNNVKKRRLIRSHPEPNTPLELVQLTGSLIRPVFLYMKKLEDSDVRKDQNRLFVNEREKLAGFLTEEERISAFGKKDEKITKPEGIDLVGIDRMGREYKLHLTKWGSLDKPVFNKEWYKIVDANGAKRGDCVHLWGYRKDDKFRLVVEFHHL